MTRVEQKVKYIAGLMGITYIFDNWQTANVRIESEKLPAMVNVLPVSGSFNLGKTQLRDYPNCMFAFIDKSELDFDGSENDKIVERCKGLAKEFILTCNRSGLFEPIEGDVRYSVMYDRLDVNVTGIVIELQLREVQGINICYNKPIKAHFDEGEDKGGCRC